jgi:hypothetical protein
LISDIRLANALSNEFWLLEVLEMDDVEAAESSESRELALCNAEIDMNYLPSFIDFSEIPLPQSRGSPSYLSELQFNAQLEPRRARKIEASPIKESEAKAVRKREAATPPAEKKKSGFFGGIGKFFPHLFGAE